MVSSSPLILMIHHRGEYPFGFDDVLIGFDLTFVMSVSQSSDFRIINIAAFRLLLSVLVSEEQEQECFFIDLWWTNNRILQILEKPYSL